MSRKRYRLFDVVSWTVLPACGLALLPAAAPAPAFAAHPHYERLLQEGTFALERNQTVQAERDLRLACFGMLDEPKRLADCLARLAHAQAAAGDDDAFRETFRRIVEVEERFGAYRAADIDPQTRQAFETDVTRLIPAKILEATPSFERLAPTEAPARGDLEETRAEKAPPAGEGATSAAPGAGDRPAPPPQVAPAGSLTPDESEQLARARERLAASRHRSDLAEPLRLAREVADARPDSSEAQALTAVVAYRASMWQEAVTYFHRAGPSLRRDPEMLFYLAVSLYETGDREAAADALERSLPHIEKTPFVLSYRDKILGPPQARDGGGSS